MIQALAQMQLSGQETIFAPNSQGVLTHTEQLTYNDASWLDVNIADQNLNFVHATLSKEVSPLIVRQCKIWCELMPKFVLAKPQDVQF